MARAARAAAGARLARDLNHDDGASEAALGAMREQHRALEQAARQCEKRVEDIKDELAELMREAAVLHGRLGDLAGERADLVDRLRVLAASSPELGAAASRAQSAVEAAEVGLAAVRDEVVRCEGVQRETAEREIELRTALERQAAAVSAARQAYEATRGRAQHIMPNGAGERLRSVLESLNGDRPAAVPTMLLEVMKAPPALEPALRAVLGEQLDAVIVDSPGFALRAIEILKENEGGRLSFVPASIASTAKHELIEAPGIAGRLLDMVEVEPRFASMAEALMGHVIVADDLRSAYTASNLNGYGTVFVTRDGDLLWPERMISGGSGIRVESDADIDMRKRGLALEAAEQALVNAEADCEELTGRYEWARIAYRDDIDALNTARARVTTAERVANDARDGLAKAAQRRHQQREVPRNDLPDHAQRLFEVIGDGVVVDLTDRAFFGADAAGKITEMVDGQGNICGEYANRFAVVQSFGESQKFQIFFHLVGDLEQDAGAIRG